MKERRAEPKQRGVAEPALPENFLLRQPLGVPDDLGPFMVSCNDITARPQPRTLLKQPETQCVQSRLEHSARQDTLL